MDKLNWLRITFWVSAIVFLWVGVAYFLMSVLSLKPSPGSVPPTTSELATIFFGASSLALIIFSLLLAMAAFVQWQSLKNELRREIELAEAAQERTANATAENQERLKNLEITIEKRTKALEERVKGLGRELQGRTSAIMGFMIGTLHSSPVLPVKNEDRDFVSEAIQLCQKGYDILKEFDGLGKYMALNNIVYYSCLIGVDSKHDFLLAQGLEIRDIGLAYDSIPYLLSFCRVEAKYGADLEELQQALSIGEEILGRKLSNIQRQEATMLVASLREKLGELAGPAN